MSKLVQVTYKGINYLFEEEMTDDTLLSLCNLLLGANGTPVPVSGKETKPSIPKLGDFKVGDLVNLTYNSQTYKVTGEHIVYDLFNLDTWKPFSARAEKIVKAKPRVTKHDVAMLLGVDESSFELVLGKRGY